MGLVVHHHLHVLGLHLLVPGYVRCGVAGCVRLSSLCARRRCRCWLVLVFRRLTVLFSARGPLGSWTGVMWNASLLQKLKVIRQKWREVRCCVRSHSCTRWIEAPTCHRMTGLCHRCCFVPPSSLHCAVSCVKRTERVHSRNPRPDRLLVLSRHCGHRDTGTTVWTSMMNNGTKRSMFRLPRFDTPSSRTRHLFAVCSQWPRKPRQPLC